MSLGEKLKNTITEIEEKETARLKALREERQLRLAKERKQKSGMLELLKKDIAVQIEQGRIPDIRIYNTMEYDWITDFNYGRSLDQDLWTSFLEWGKSEQLNITLKKKEFDKYDMETYITLTAKPIT